MPHEFRLSRKLEGLGKGPQLVGKSQGCPVTHPQPAISMSSSVQKGGLYGFLGLR